MKGMVSIALCCATLNGYCHAASRSPAQTVLKAYYTRLPFDDNGYSGKYADIVVELPQQGRFVFSRESSYQPYWAPVGGKQHHVDRMIPRKGDGPEQRPDKHNICSNASIVKKTETAVTVHWRYAPDLAKESFVDFLSAYNKVGNPSPFYAEYADEYFTVYADGTLVRTVKKGCVKLAERNDPENQIEQRLRLTPTGIEQTSLIPANVSRLRLVPVLGERVKTGRTDNLLLHWPFDEGMGQTTREQIADVETTVLGATGAFSPGRRTVSR